MASLLYNIHMDLPSLKNNVIELIDAEQASLWEVSTYLFEHPEVAFQEKLACEILTDRLRSAGMDVVIGIGRLGTAFRAKIGSGRPIIAILAEYDALPGLGHACGHNLIATSALGAGLALNQLPGRPNGQVQIIGTPAEEGGGGKITLANAGVFDGIDAAMMFHPASKNLTTRGSLASAKLTLEFFGKASHAAAAPEDGINALDALLLAFNNINAIRPTLSARDRIAGIITHGGEACNIIPAFTSAKFSIRSNTTRRRELLVQRVIACAQAGADAIGCSLKSSVTPGYADIIPNPILADLFGKNLQRLGREVSEPDPNERMGSTDMGDISHLLPSIHAYLATVPEDVAGHTEAFRNLCLSEPARLAMLDAAKALALTTLDLLFKPAYLVEARSALDVYLSQN